MHYHGQVCSTTDVRRSLINRTEPLEKNNDEKLKIKTDFHRGSDA